VTRQHAVARIDLGAIRANVAALRVRTTAEVLAVVKADGYGHGLVASDLLDRLPIVLDLLQE
jgi:alanine racemase